MAQSRDDSWQSPWNVSLSGTATRPIIAVSAEGSFHLFWQDRQSGYMLMRQEAENWSEPQRVLVPFTDPPFSSVIDAEDFGEFYQPLLRVDGMDVLHALWLDDEGKLLYNRVPLADIAMPESWAQTVVLAPAVRGFDLAPGDNGRLHLAYIQAERSTQFSPGVYYRQSESGGANWSEPEQIYESNYLRPVEPGTANLQLAQAATGEVFLVWDNPLLETVFLARAVNFGADWEPPVVIDRRLEGDALESPGASNIGVLVDGDMAHLIWYAGHQPRTCTIYHQLSEDGGETWQPYRAVINLGLECPEESLLLLDNNNVLFLLVKRVLRASERTEIFLQAWDGTQWSAPELQEALTDFQDPETYRKVSFDCLQGSVTPENALFLATCGSTRSLSDVWVLERPLGELTDWSERFAPPSVWSRPTLVANSPSTVGAPSLFNDTEGKQHLFWYGENRDDLSQAIYYSVWNQNEWSRPLPVLEMPEEGNGRYSIAFAARQQRFLAAWHDTVTEGLLLSQVEVEAAVLATDWSVPQTLAHGEVAIGNIVVAPNGTIYLAYSIPINEGRGVYLIQSLDGGATWTEPLLILDASEAGWYGVGAPNLKIGPDDHFHLTITRQFSSGKVGLYYLSSTDSRTWTTPEERIEGTIVWTQLDVDPAGSAHLLWALQENSRTTTWHTVSNDNGLSWQAPVSITDLVGTHHNIALAQDAAGSLYLLQVQDNLLLNRRWDGARWLSLESLYLAIGENEIVIQIDALADAQNLDVIYASRITKPTENTDAAANIVPGTSDTLSQTPIQDVLYQAQQELNLTTDLQLPTPPPLPTPTISPTNTTSLVAPSIPTPLSPMLENLEEAETSPLAVRNPVLQTLISFLPALLVVALTFGFAAFRIIKR